MRAQLSGMSGIVQDIADAITRQEGTGCGRNNNPGNLRTWGDLPTVGGFAMFPDCAAGRRALERQVQLNIDRGLTLEEFFGGRPGVYGGYAPSSDNNQPLLYASNVSSWTGVPLGVPLNLIGGGEYSVDPATPDNNTALLVAVGIVALALALT